MDFFKSFIIFYIIVLTAVIFIILKPFIESRAKFFVKILNRINKKIKNMIIERRVKHTIEVMITPYRTTSLNDVLLVAVVYLFVGYLILAKFLFLAVVVSNSMYPTVEKGDLVLIQTISKEPEVGDIILFKGKPTLDPERRELILHRVYAIKGNKILTKGDAMPVPDPWVVSKNDIVGKAVTIGGYPVVIKGAGKDLVIEPGKKITNPVAVYYIIGTMRKFGFLIFILIILIYILFEVVPHAKKKSIS